MTLKPPYSIEWEDYIQLKESERAKYLSRNGNLYDLIFSQQYNRELLERLYVLTNKIRLISKTKDGKRFLQGLLDTKRVMLYFIQPSTRTFLSFHTACSNLGLTVADVRSTEISSESKGETYEDTIRVFSSYFDMIIMRHPDEGSAEKASYVLNNLSRRPIPVVNAGSGKDQHPTQALLDIFTLQKSFSRFGGVDGKTVMFVGDLKRGRTVRSLTYLLTNYKDIRFIFCAPEGFGMEEDIKTYLAEKKYEFIETQEMNKYLPEADALYMTRLQDEYDTIEGESKSYNTVDFSINENNIDLMKGNACILHPLPRRSELSTAIDNDPRALYWRQMRNGMWARTALIAHIFGVEQTILDY